MDVETGKFIIHCQHPWMLIDSSMSLIISSSSKKPLYKAAYVVHVSHTPYTLFSSSKTLNSLFLILVAMATIFSKYLTKSDIEHSKLTVPTSALPYFMGIIQQQHYANIPVIDWTGQLREFRIYTRPDDLYKKPVLTKGWPQFVREKGLRECDEVIFSENQDEEGGLQYRILVLRRPQLFSLGGSPVDRDFNEPPFIVPDPAAPIFELDLSPTYVNALPLNSFHGALLLPQHFFHKR